MKKYFPSLGSSNIPMTLSKVDFPEPDGPMMEMKSPSWMVRLMSFRMKDLVPATLYHLKICSNLIMFKFKILMLIFLCCVFCFSR